MEKPLITVIMPCYNSANTIRCAIDSVYAQTLPVSVLVIDDGSKDDLAGALSPYMDRPDFRLLKNETNLGVAKSRMRGVRHAATPYVAFLDADDWWAPEKLRVQYERMEETGAVLSSTARELFDAAGRPVGRVIHLPEIIDARAILRTNHLNCSAVMVKRDVMLEFPMEHDDSHEDYISWIRIIRRYGWALGIDEPYLKYRLSAGGKSRNKLKSARMNFMVYRYCGFSLLRSICCFISYAFWGVKKYYL
ncbi:MAG: glycosyltransferase [Lachnospiraceae bacterium]|nr:glycosyltransferase [Lachnospiraceae bacterium]